MFSGNWQIGPVAAGRLNQARLYSGFPKCTEKIIISVQPKYDFRIHEGKFFLAAFPISMEITSLIEYPLCNPSKGMCVTL